MRMTLLLLFPNLPMEGGGPAGQTVAACFDTSLPKYVYIVSTCFNCPGLSASLEQSYSDEAVPLLVYHYIVNTDRSNCVPNVPSPWRWPARVGSRYTSTQQISSMRTWRTPQCPIALTSARPIAIHKCFDCL